MRRSNFTGLVRKFGEGGNEKSHNCIKKLHSIKKTNFIYPKEFNMH